MPMRLGYPAGRAGLRHSLSSAPLTHAAWCVRLRVALPDAPASDTLSLSSARRSLMRPGAFGYASRCRTRRAPTLSLCPPWVQLPVEI